MSGCSHLGSPEQKQGNTDYPQNNPTPTQVITIEGTVSPTLSVKLNAVYEGTISADCWKSKLYSAGEFEGTATPLRHTAPIELTEDGEHFSGKVIVDRFVPGKCRWHLQSIVAKISKERLPDEQVLVAKALDGATSVEGQQLNSSDAPSFIHVKYVGGVLGWLFVPNLHVKSLQGIVDATHTIEIHIIDDGSQSK